MSRFMYDPDDALFRVRNDVTGRYVCDCSGRIKVFRTRWRALQFIKSRSLNQDVYYPEVA